jgi:hypothetical protein
LNVRGSLYFSARSNANFRTSLMLSPRPPKHYSNMII